MTDTEALLVGAALGAVVVVFYLVLRAFLRLAGECQKALRDQYDAFEVERRELLERIQRPERIPSAAAAPPRESPPMDPEKAKAYAAVGSVQPYRGES